MAQLLRPMCLKQATGGDELGGPKLASAPKGLGGIPIQGLTPVWAHLPLLWEVMSMIDLGGGLGGSSGCAVVKVGTPGFG